jgi:predicted permease
MEQADAQSNALYSGIINDVEAPLQTGMSDQQMEQFRARKLVLSEGYRGQSNMHQEASTPLIMLFCITGLVLLIACANVANLLLARGARRGMEMAVRGSMGAPRRQLVGQLLTESVLLGILGGVASILVAYWTLGLMARMLPPEEAQTMAFGLRPSVFVFTGLLALGTGVLFGLYPAFHSTRRDLVSIIKANTGQPSGSRGAKRFRGSLVTAQIALSMTLLVVAGLFISSLANVSRVELGIASDNLVTFSIAPVLSGYEPERSAGFFQQLEEELAAIPGVTEVSASMVPLLTGNSWGNSVRVEGFENEDPEVDRGSRYNQIGPNYLATMGMPLIAGREFGISDVAGAPPVAIVNEAFTRKFNLDGREAVGKYMAEGGGDDLDIQIVGVVQDAKYNDVKQAVPPMYLRPYKQDETLGFLTFYVRTAADPAPVLRSIPDVVRRLDPNLPVDDLKRMQDQIRENTFGDRMVSILAAAFATLATVLAAIGLYGVLAYTVAQRTREIGLRMALGADRGRVQTMVFKQVSTMLALGGVLGLLAAFGLAGVAESILFGVERLAVLPMIAAAGILGVVAYGAGYLPARRASRVDPMDALRQD